MLHFWFPVDCLICGQPPHEICPACLKSIPFRPHKVERLGLIPGWAAGDYEGDLMAVVHHFKKHGSVSFAIQMAKEMLPMARSWLEQLRSDHPPMVFVVPAPSRPESVRKKGYSPAGLLAKEFARRLRASGVNAKAIDCLKLRNGVQDQSLLNAHERQENLAGNMTVSPSGVSTLSQSGASVVILLDDIVTTGATLREMQRALTEAGKTPQIFLAFAETL